MSGLSERHKIVRVVHWKGSRSLPFVSNLIKSSIYETDKSSRKDRLNQGSVAQQDTVYAINDMLMTAADYYSPEPSNSS